MGGRTSQTQTGTQTTQMPENQQANVDMLLGGARDFYAGGGPRYYGGNTVAGTDPLTTAGRSGATGYAGGQGLDFTRNYMAGENQFLDTNNIYNPTRMPGYARAREAVQTDATNNLTRNILPQIRSGAIADGAYGGSRQGIAEGLASAETARGVGDTLARMDMDAYSQGLGMYNSAANRAPTSYGLGLMPSQTMMGVGDANRSDAQRQIDADMARHNFEQMRPLLNLQNLQSLTGQAGTYGGTTTQTQTGNMNGGAPWMQGLGAIMSMMSMMGSGQGGGAGGGGGGMGFWGGQAAQVGG